jgi:apolipoprotein N-acyltransferase
VVVNARRQWPAATLVAALTITLAGWGWWRLGNAPVEGAASPLAKTLRVGIIQGNVPQDRKWSPEFASEIFNRYLRLSREAAQQGARLIVWPESSTPFLFEEDVSGGEAIRQLARQTGTWLLIGSDQVAAGRPSSYYNAAFLVDPQGRTAAVYRKQLLVPFGEYVPLKSLLFFVGPVVDAVADFSAGTETTLLPVDGTPLSMAICYEIIFGYQARGAVRAGSQLLTTITNDAWYGESSAPWQHFDQASARAIELGRYLVRAANTGISGVVDPYGRVVARRGLFETGILVQDVELLETCTLYCRIGDSFAWACLAVSLILLIRNRGHRRAGWTRAAR